MNEVEEPNWWDGYEPEHDDEFELCSACQNGRPHSLEEHNRIVEATRNGDSDRIEIQVWVPIHEEESRDREFNSDADHSRN